MFTLLKARVSLLVAMAVLLAAGALAAGQFEQASQAEPALPIGSWSVDAQPDPGGPLPPLASFAAFTRDGILINSNDTGHTAVGAWTRIGPRSFAVRFTGFDVIEGQRLRYIVRSSLELSGDGANLDGPFQTDIYTADGSHIASATGTVHGDRLAVQPLP
jgi:hypothetical protein